MESMISTIGKAGLWDLVPTDAAPCVAVAMGLAVRVERQVAKVTTIHCIAHNLQLAILDAAKEVPYLAESLNQQ